jgi:hypothetical protein
MICHNMEIHLYSDVGIWQHLSRVVSGNRNDSWKLRIIQLKKSILGTKIVHIGITDQCTNEDTWLTKKSTTNWVTYKMLDIWAIDCSDTASARLFQECCPPSPNLTTIDQLIYECTLGQNCRSINDTFRCKIVCDDDWFVPGTKEVSALHIACLRSHNPIVGKLLAVAVIDVNVIDNYRCTPLDYACKHGHRSEVYSWYTD